MLQSRVIFMDGRAQHAPRLQPPDCSFQPLLVSRAAHLLEVAVDGVALRHRKLGKGIFHAVQLQVAALGNLHGPRQHRRRILEQPRHLVRALHKKLVAVELEPVGVVNLRARLHAQHHLVRVRVLAAQVVRVVRRHQRNPQLPLQPVQIGLDLFLRFQTLILNLQEEISLAEDVLVLLCDGNGLRVLAFVERLAQLSAQAAGKTDQALRILREILLAHARTPVEPVQRCLRREPDQVPVSLLVLGQHQQVVVVSFGVSAR